MIHSLNSRIYKAIIVIIVISAKVIEKRRQNKLDFLKITLVIKFCFIP